MQQIEWDCTILENKPLNDQFFILTLQGEAISRSAQPGQFVNVSCQQFLRRPLGIMAVDRTAGTFQIGIQVKGKGTLEFKDLKPGTVVSVLGPLGHGFDLAGVRRVITVGGGTGVFPLYFVQEHCLAAGVETVAVCGFRSVKDAILVDEFRRVAGKAVFASDNGGMDVDGHAALALDKVLADLDPLAGTVVLTCGPKIMMQAVAERAAQAGLPCQVSLEERMGCGIGNCLVCVCKIKEQGTGEISHQRCCVEGPVFPAEAVVW
ncbi:MAG: dihydroorotate dehydrogenase electron transfer subunit [Clostridia bacterium]|nr:dihydroorotate dehydrogenase electron transfer subunit [Clostridia bacterium]NCC74916.1 dihydroorotate dehydrogenase electron transfer subunit [Clostridia bacterium]